MNPEREKKNLKMNTVTSRNVELS